MQKVDYFLFQQQSYFLQVVAELIRDVPRYLRIALFDIDFAQRDGVSALEDRHLGAEPTLQAQVKRWG